MMNVKTKSIIAAVLLVAALVSAFGISRWQSSPDTHAASIQYLDEKQETVMKLTAASTAASVAISALPSDTGDAVSQKLMDLNSKFLIVLCAVMLEKYLLTITGYAVFRFIVPAACVFFIAYVFCHMELLKKAAGKLFLFGMAIWLAVPFGITISRMIEGTYDTSLTQTVEDVQSAADSAEESSEGSDAQNKSLWSSITSAVKDTVSNAAEKFETMLSDLMEALAVMIVTSCIIPVLVLMFMLWIVKVLLALDINLPSLPLRHPARTDDTN